MSNRAPKYDQLIKLLLIGDSGVGKSCLLLRYADDSFTSSFITTIGIDFKIKMIMCDDVKVKLQMWDTAGQERFRTIASSYYRGAMGFLLVYNVTDVDSFTNVRNWMREIDKNATNIVNRVLIGNNCDVDSSERKVTKEQGEALAQEYGIRFFETSAKLDINVDECFMAIAKDIVERLKENPDHIDDNQASDKVFVAGPTEAAVVAALYDDQDDGDDSRIREVKQAQRAELREFDEAVQVEIHAVETAAAAFEACKNTVSEHLGAEFTERDMKKDELWVIAPPTNVSQVFCNINDTQRNYPVVRKLFQSFLEVLRTAKQVKTLEMDRTTIISRHKKALSDLREARLLENTTIGELHLMIKRLAAKVEVLEEENATMKAENAIREDLLKRLSYLHLQVDTLQFHRAGLNGDLPFELIHTSSHQHLKAIGSVPLPRDRAVCWTVEITNLPTYNSQNHRWLFIGIIGECIGVNTSSSYNHGTCYGWAGSTQVYLKGVNNGEHGGWSNWETGDVGNITYNPLNRTVSADVRKSDGRINRYTIDNIDLPNTSYIHFNLHTQHTKVRLIDIRHV